MEVGRGRGRGQRCVRGRGQGSGGSRMDGNASTFIDHPVFKLLTGRGLSTASRLVFTTNRSCGTHLPIGHIRLH